MGDLGWIAFPKNGVSLSEILPKLKLLEYTSS